MRSANKRTGASARSKSSLSQLGLMDVSVDDFNMDGNDSDTDSDLEAELNALNAGSHPRKPARNVKKPASDLDAMIAESLKDIPDDVSDIDDDDPDILNELSEIVSDEEVPLMDEPKPQPASPTDTGNTLITTLTERLEMYRLAEENAKTSGETSRARRFNRGYKTLLDLIKTAKAGRSIKEEDIPPVVSVTAHSKPPAPVQESNHEETSPKVTPALSPELPQVKPDQNETITILNRRKLEYKAAALLAKKSGDKTNAIEFIKMSKKFDMVIEAVQNGQEIDLAEIPQAPSYTPIGGAPMDSTKEESGVQMHAEEAKVEEIGGTIDRNAPIDLSQVDNLPEERLVSAGSMLEALEQRLEKYKSEEDKAKSQDNPGKARRMGRIVKQYQDAIKLHKAGKPIPIDELPTPPGFAALPVAAAKPAPKPPTPKITPETDQPGASRRGGNQVSTNLNEQQLKTLLDRQKEFKLAALNAKKNGDVTRAKEYLRISKGFDKLIDASRSGLPVDMSTLPVAVEAKAIIDDEFVHIDAGCSADDTDILSHLHEQLTKQLKLCVSTSEHYKAMGDVANANRFQQLAASVTANLKVIKYNRTHGGCTPPKFHYEIKHFSVVKCNTDLNDDELELTIVRGINYKCPNPSDLDTYIKFEFPFPQEEPFTGKTEVVKDTNNPEYGDMFKIPIQRKARTCQRVFKRHGIKLEVYAKGGWFRSDTLLGTIQIKLLALENQITIHESFDIMDGRKPLGGKVEVRVRIRDPILTKQIEELSERWLVLD